MTLYEYINIIEAMKEWFLFGIMCVLPVLLFYECWKTSQKD